MKQIFKNPTLLRSLAAAALLGACGLAMAAGGNVSGVSVTPATVFVNDIITLKINITDGSYGVDCNAAWSVRDSGNVEVKSGGTRMMSDSNSYVYQVQFGIATPGVYTVQAHTGTPSAQAVSCLGNATATLTVKAKAPPIGIATPVNPVIRANPIPVNPGNPGPVRKQ
jgi:hypothetical protein